MMNTDNRFARPPARNSYQDARGMEGKAKQMLEPSVAGKIFQGLGELWDKAPAGIAEAAGKGTKAAGKAIGETVDTFLHDEGMHKGLKQAGKFALAGAAIPAITVGGAYAATQAPAIYGTLLANPQLINEGTDFVQGLFPGVPPASRGGYAGAGLSQLYEQLKDRKQGKK